MAEPSPAEAYAAFRSRRSTPALAAFADGYGFDFDDYQREACAHVEAGSGVLVDAHGMEPDAVFALLKALGGDIPKLLVVGCEPAEVSERMGLSPPVAGAVDQAMAVVRELIGEHESGKGG